MAERFEDRYRMALHAHLADPSGTALSQARALGSAAVQGGVVLQDFVATHEDALASTLVPDHTPADLARTLGQGRRFLVEALSAYQSSQVGNAVLRRLNARLNTKLEDEARHIARTLHDEAGQLLASVHLALQELARDAQPNARERIGRIRSMVDEIERDLRNLCHEMRPTILDTMGLQPAVEFLAGNVATQSNLRIDVRGSIEDRLSPVMETNLYRIVQEALANAARHSGAAHVVVQLDRRPREVTCSVTDDGVGFDPGEVSQRATTNGLGLPGMQERAELLGGTLEIRSQPDHGTEIRVRVPTES